MIDVSRVPTEKNGIKKKKNLRNESILNRIQNSSDKTETEQFPLYHQDVHQLNLISYHVIFKAFFTLTHN